MQAMTSKERVKKALNHETPDKLPIDMGSTGVTGVHCLIVEKLRDYFGLEKKPVKVIDPYQMLGEVDQELIDIIGIDVIGAGGRNNMFGFPNENWKEFKTPWGQTVLVGEKFNYSYDDDGSILLHPGGDTSAPPSGRMPKDSYFFDTIIRQEPFEEDQLNPEDNLEEFTHVGEEEIAHWKKVVKSLKGTDKAVIGNFGDTGLGDIALVPAPFMKYPKGIRDITEWYMSTVMRTDYVKKVFDRQTDIAIENMKVLKDIVGDTFDILYICGTDLGTQDSQFCSPETFEDLWLPYYKKMNDWIHENTNWKTFKHCCGSIEPLLPNLIRAGFDIINPVQINAAGMDPNHLKKQYGNQVTFWGGGVDTHKVLPYGKPEQVREDVLRNCEIFSKGGGFVFNTVHNIQANVPLENVVAMIDAFREFNGEKQGIVSNI